HQRPSLRAGPTAWIPQRPQSCTESYTSAASVARGAQLPPAKKQNDTKWLKNEFRRLGETRQRSGRGVEHRTTADIAVGAAIKHGLALRAAAEHANEAAAVFELIEQRRRNHLGRSLQQDH